MPAVESARQCGMSKRVRSLGIIVSVVGVAMIVVGSWIARAHGIPIFGLPPHGGPGVLRARAGDVVTFHNDNLRTGANLAEFSLTPERVLQRDGEGKPRLKEDFCWKVDGKVFAQPLYVADVATPGGPRDLVFIAPPRNSVYAFDPEDRRHADPSFFQAPPASCRGVVDGDLPGARVWKWEGRQPSVGLVPAKDFPFGSQVVVDTGIVSTPVIDVDANRIYFVTRSGAGCRTPTAGDGTPLSDDKLCRFHLLSLDIRTGAEQSRTLIDADFTDHKTGRSFAFRSMAGAQRNRAGLLLAGGIVYLAFGPADSGPGDGDCHEFHGWVFGYDTATLGPTSRPSKLWVSTPAWYQGGIWQGNNGLAADDNAVYLMTANTVHPHAVATAAGCGATPAGPPGAVLTNDSPLIVPSLAEFNGPEDLFDSDPTHASYVDSFVALDRRLEASGLMRVAGAYSESETKPGATKSRFWCRTENDWDVGSSGPVLLPDDRLVGGGKDGVLQILKRSTMGNLSSNELALPLGPDPSSDPEGCRTPYHTMRGIFGAPVFWRVRDPATKAFRELLYVWPAAIHELKDDGSVLLQFELDGATLKPAPVSDEMRAIGQGAVGYDLGGVLSLSASGSRSGTGIVWANLEFWDAAASKRAHRLYAFHAETSKELWHWQFDPLDSSRAPDGSYMTQTSYARYSSPTVSRGRVFLAGMEPFDPAERGQDGRVHVFSFDPPDLAPCRPDPAACRGRSCGNVADGCGGSLNCGNCGPEQICADGRCTGPRGCCPPSCPRGTTCSLEFCRCVLPTP
jgi:hypothetical protein